MTTTTTLRKWWAPPCHGPFTRVALHGEGMVTVRSSIRDAVHALNLCLIAHGYRTRRADTGGYNCRRITGGTNYSLHAFGTAVDINWQSNPYGRRLVTDMPPAMVAAIKAIRTVNGRQVWRWGGDYSGNKDAMHFEIVCHPSDLATGIDPLTLPPSTVPEEDDMAMTPQERQALIDDIAAAVEARLTDDIGTLNRDDTVRRNSIASLIRRVLGIPLMADGSEQHIADSRTGAAVAAALGLDDE